jgi:fructokinase
MYDVLCFGELLIDFTSKGLSDQGNVLFEKNPGGAPANVSVCMSKLGKKSAFMGMVGKDIFGEYLKNYLKSMNVDVKGLKKTEKAKTTLAFVEIDKKAERSFNFYRNPGADTLFAKKDIDYKLIDNSKIFHFGSLSMTSKLSRDALFNILKYSKKKGLLVSYDPNYRHLLWNNSAEAKKIFAKD